MSICPGQEPICPYLDLPRKKMKPQQIKRWSRFIKKYHKIKSSPRSLPHR